MEDKTYDWVGTTCAPTQFPVRLLKGVLYLPGGSRVSLPMDAYLGAGWGITGSSMLVGDQLKPLPDSLTVTWFSILERKFYKGSFDLTTLPLARIFDAGFTTPSSNLQGKYHYIIFGFAPGGNISVWLAADNIYKEIGVLHAHETTVDMESFLGTASDLEKYVTLITQGALTKAETAPIDMTMPATTKWSALYRKTYYWQPKAIMTVPVEAIGLEFFNGERLYWADTQLLHKVGSRPVPRACSLYWTEDAGQKRITKISFDEQEIFEAFDKISGEGDTIILQLEVNKLEHSAEVYLHDQKNSIALHKIKVQAL